MRLAIAALCVCVCACLPEHGPAVPALPSAGGPVWTELTSDHFVMWTDVQPERGSELLQEMEVHRQVVLGIALNNAESHAKILVLALRDAEEVGAYVPKQFVAFAWGTPNPIRMPVITLNATTPEHDIHIVTHELTHAIMFPVIPHQPPWFAEGLAGYFETAYVHADHESVDLGKPLDYIIQRLHTGRRTTVAELFACDQHPCMDDGFYAMAWALFAYLVNQHQAQLLALTHRIGELPRGAWKQAWAETFSGVTPEQLDHEVAVWLAHGTHQEMHYALKVRPTSVSERPLSDKGALAARALLGYMWHPQEQATSTAVDTALAADPGSLVASLLKASMLHTAPTPEAAHVVADAHPDDWRAQWLLGYSLSGKPESVGVRDKMCALIAAGSGVMDAPAEYCAPHGGE
jgi:hypothetical protein